MLNKSFFHFLSCAVVFVIAVLFLLPSDDIAQKFELPIVGQNSPRSIYAQVSFDVPKNPQELEEDIKRAKDRVYPVFEYNEDATEKLVNKFEQLISQIEKYSELQKEISGEVSVDREKIAMAGDLYQSIIRQISATALKQLTQSEASSIDTLRNIFNSIILQGVSNTLIAEKSRDVNVFEEMHNVNAVNYILYSRSDVLLIKNGKDTLVDASFIRPKELLIDYVLNKRKNFFGSNGASSAFYEILYVFTSPNIFYLDKETERRKNDAALQVNTSKGMVPRGMEIVSQGSVVTKEIVEKLEAMQTALQKDSSMLFNTANYGQYLLFLLIASTLCFYLWRFRIDKNIQLSQMLAICIIAIMQVVLFRLVHGFFFTSVQSEHLNPVWLYPFSFAPILISVLFPLRTAAAIATWSSVLFGIFAGYDLLLTISAYIISFAMAFIVNRIRYRVKFMQSFFTGLSIFSVALVVILLLRNSMSFMNYAQNFLLGAANLLICVTFTSVFCSVFERVFKITTSLKLMELSDFNHPLLRSLSEYAPGSFHHSIQVGNLGEIAGERIGANTLLIRVMALYHDIGKIMRPEFFTENQRFGYNPHDNLSPYDSIKILRSHVERGMEYAEEYKLPDKVSDGIREHHGNTAAYFFYNKAKEMYPDKDIKFSDFCYKGSIPQSKEAAVLMLADSIEAISRSMQNAKPDELSSMIQKTIEDKMFEEQLNDSGLTIGDIKELGDGFLQGLEGSTHSRVKYATGGIFLKKQRETK